MTGIKIKKQMLPIIAFLIIGCSQKNRVSQPYVESVPNKYQRANSKNSLGYLSAQGPFVNLKGNIKSIKTFEYRVYADSLNLEDRLVEIEEFLFDRDNRVYEKIFYRVNDNSKVRIFYHDFSEVIQDSVLFYDTTDNIISKEYYYYFDKSKTIATGTTRISNEENKDNRYEKVYKNDSIYLILNFHKRAIYDSLEYWSALQDDLFKYTYYPNRDRKSYTQLRKNKVTLKEEYDRYGFLTRRETREYVADTLSYGFISTFNLDSIGIQRFSTEKMIFGNGDTGKIGYGEMEYNEYNQPLARYMTINDNRRIHYTKKYNPYGDLIETRENRDVERYEYSQYDEHQNRRVRKFWTNDEPYSRVEREIKYYED